MVLKVFVLRKNRLNHCKENDLREKIVLIYEQILKKANEQCARLQQDPVAWAEMQAENEEWDGTLADGVDED